MTLFAFTDGASRGNPGESGIGLLVKDSAGKIIMSLGGYIGKATNNVAEYMALLALLNRMKQIRCTKLIIHSDSELMVRQLLGEYRVKDEGLKKYYQRVSRLLEDCPCEFELKYIPRSENRDADRLANMAINTKKRIKI